MNANALVEQPEQVRTVTPMDMLDRALASGASIEVLDKLLTLRERYEASQARKLFDAAIASAKAEIPVISKNRTGHNSKRYADFAAIAAVIDPILGKYGLSYRFRSAQTDKITVTCILSHEAGHYEETSLAGPADTTGSKNAIQAIGSTLSYLQRYTLVQALGLASSDDDDDGQAAGSGEKITEEQATALRDLAEKVGADLERFCAFMKVASLPEIPAHKFADAEKALRAKGSHP